jgi:hypothetical protein
MVEHAKEEEEGQQPDKGRHSTPGLSQARLGHHNHDRSGRQALRGARAGVMKFHRWYEMHGAYSTHTAMRCGMHVR